MHVPSNNGQESANNSPNKTGYSEPFRSSLKVPARSGKKLIQKMMRRKASSTSSDHSGENVPPPSSPMQTRSPQDAPQSRRNWLEQSIVRRTVAHVRTHLDDTIEATPLLQEHHFNPHHRDSTPALLHRSEVRSDNSSHPLGSGGFSDVFAVTEVVLDDTISRRCTPVQQERRRQLAEDVATGRAQYAIKHLRAKLLQSSSSKNYFQQAAYDLVMESQYLERLQQHSNVIRLSAVPVDGVDAWNTGEHDGYFLLLERLDCTLADRIQSWKQQAEPLPSQAEQLEYVLAIAKALRYLHQRHRRIVYRDLKPQNLGITCTGRVVLFDFGLCRQLPCEEEAIDGLYAMSGVGTRRYMAPEVLRNGRYNHQADVYSLSMVAWELLSGCRPYLRYGLDEHRQAVCFGHERPRLLPGWSDWLRGFFQCSWHADPSARWDAETMVAKLQSYLHPAPPSPVSVATATTAFRSKSLKVPVLDLRENIDYNNDVVDDSARSLPLLRYKHGVVDDAKPTK